MSPPDQGTEPKRALIVWADETSPNLGVRVLAAGTRQVLESAWPGVDVEFHNGEGRSTAPCSSGRKSVARALVQASHPLSRWMSGFDLVVDTGGGDSFTSIYGMSRLSSIVAFRRLAISRAGSTVLGPQTIGPFTSRGTALLARSSVIGTAGIFTRDGVSEKFVHDVLKRDPLASTDVVFALPRSPRGAQSHDIVLNVSGLLWKENPHVDHVAYRRACEALCRWAASSGRKVTLLVHVLDNPSHDRDREACEELSRLGEGSPLRVLVPRDLSHVREELAGANVVIGSRMHACLNALSVGTPAIPWAYSRKFEPLLADIGWPGALPIARADLVPQTVEWLQRLSQGPAGTEAVVRSASERLEHFRRGVRSVLADGKVPFRAGAPLAHQGTSRIELK